MTDKKHTKQELSDYFASFYGMDGGNLNASIWICGIEYGDTAEDFTPRPGDRELGHWDQAKRLAHPTYHRWPYWEKLSKIMLATRRAVAIRHAAPDIPITWQQYRDHFLYSAGGWEFKLNLFPLASASDDDADWKNAHSDQPELSDKGQYRMLCREGGRFDFIHSIRLKYRPKLIIATGLETEADFLNAFGFQGAQKNEEIIKVDDDSRRIIIYTDPSDGQQCVLVVVSFPVGRWGFNSDRLIDKLGERLAEWLAPDDFPTLPPVEKTDS